MRKASSSQALAARPGRNQSATKTARPSLGRAEVLKKTEGGGVALFGLRCAYFFFRNRPTATAPTKPNKTRGSELGSGTQFTPPPDEPELVLELPPHCWAKALALMQSPNRVARSCWRVFFMSTSCLGCACAVALRADVMAWKQTHADE